MIQTETGRKLIMNRVNWWNHISSRISKSRHVEIEPKVPAAKKPVLVNKSDKTSFNIEVPNKDDSVPQLVTWSGQVVRPPKTGRLVSMHLV